MIEAIREAIADLLRDVEGVQAASPYPPESVGAVPALWVGAGSYTVLMGALEVWEWTLPITVVVSRVGMAANELKATERILNAIHEIFVDNYSLGMGNQGVYAAKHIGGREGEVTWGGSGTLLGITLELLVTYKLSRTVH